VPAEPVAVDVALARQTSDRRVVLMNDGEALRGDPASPEKGDKFKLVIRTNCDCYVYIVEIDGSGWAQGVFPGRSSYANPLKRDQEYAFPEGANWYALDEVPGVETFYIVVWPQPRPDLEESIARVAGNERPRGRADSRRICAHDGRSRNDGALGNGSAGTSDTAHLRGEGAGRRRDRDTLVQTRIAKAER
jgi:hypothetical protein